MTSSGQPRVEAMREAILEDAARRRTEILAHAHEQADELLARASLEAAQVRLELLESARIEAERCRGRILAGVPIEAGRLRSARIERELDGIRDEVRRKLAAVDLRSVARALAADAVRCLDGEVFVIKLFHAFDELDDAELSRQIASDVGRRPLSIAIQLEARAGDGGAVVEDPDGHRVWDNRLQVRLDRLWPELRRQIAVHTGLSAESVRKGGRQ